MKSTIITAIVLVGWFASIGLARSPSIPSHEVAGKNALPEQFQVYVIEDPSRKLTIDDIASGRIEGSLTSSRFNVESAEVDYWFCFTLTNGSNAPVDRIVRFDEPYAEEANIYYRQGESWYTERDGLSVPIGQRPVGNRNPVFAVTIQPGQSKTIYLKLHSNYGMLTIGIYVETPQSFLKYEQLATICYFFYFGAVCALIVYNLFLFASLREKLYAYYVLHGLCYVTWVLIYSGFDLYIGISESLHYRLNSITNLVLTFMVLFTRQLLQTQVNLPKIDKSLVAIAAMAFISGIASFIDISYYQYLTFLALPSYIYLMLVGIYAWLKRIELSNYYLLSMGLYFTGIILLGLLLTDLLPYNLITRYFYLPGSLGELTIFSMALAHRVKLLQNQNSIYQQELIRTERKAKEQLEVEVAERTAELKQANEELARIAQQDGLTGLANRRFLDERLNQEWLRMKRERGVFSMIICDIDYFKNYNDYYGHQGGDECLRQVAQSIRGCIRRPSDFAGRYGGEEFLILLPNTDEKGASGVAEEIRTALCDVAIEHKKSEVASHVSLSLGVAFAVPHKGGNPEELVSAADGALYKAKKQGRNQVCIA